MLAMYIFKNVDLVWKPVTMMSPASSKLHCMLSRLPITQPAVSNTATLALSIRVKATDV